MTILVIGGTGTVGSRVVTGLQQSGVTVRCMTHIEANLENIPAGVEGCLGDLEKPMSLLPVFENIDKVFLVTPLSQNETLMGLAAVQAAKLAGVKHIVYMSVPLPPGSEEIPHFRTKIPIENAIRVTGLPYTFLRPNNFFQNDVWCQAAIMLYNTYPQPIGMSGCNEIDVRDVADAAVTVLTKAGHEFKDYELHGAESLTGPKVAAMYSEYLGREVTYGGDDLDTWSKQAQHMMPEWMLRDLKIMYEYLQRHGLQASPEKLHEQARLLGRAPRSFRAYVAEVTTQWKQQAEESAE